MQMAEFLNRLSGVRKQNGQYMAQCPAHQDRKASLSVSTGDKGILVTCHAGCESDSILEILDLTWDDLFSEEPKRRGEPLATYDYVDEEGKLLYQVRRWDGKRFSQHTPNGTGWTNTLNGVRRVPYMLADIYEADLDTPIFIVEGEKDVHSLRARGVLATTNSGGAGWDWPQEWCKFFAGRIVYLVPDMDEPGINHMNQIGELLADVADVYYIRLGDVKDITDWYALHGGKDHAWEHLVASAQPWMGPISLIQANVIPEEQFEWPDAPILNGIFGEIVQLIEPHTEADPKAIFMELMVMFGSCLGAGPTYMVGQTAQRGNMYLVIVGDTATARKGTAHDWAAAIFKMVDPHYTVTRIFSGMTSGEGLIAAVRDPVTTVDKKGELQVIDEGVPDKRILCFEPEFAGRTLVAMKREGSTLSSVLRQAWDNTPMLSTMTKRDVHVATGAHVSVIGHCTIKELRSMLRPEDVAGGFANRFMFMLVRRSKRLTQQTEPNADHLKRLTERLRLALSEARKVTVVTLHPDAQATWQDIYEQIDAELSRDEGEQLQFLARGCPIILRMALILALANGSSTIRPDDLIQAQGLFAYARRTVEFMLDASISTMTTDEKRLFNLLEVNGPMNRSQIREKLKWDGARTANACFSLTRKNLTYEKLERVPLGRPRKVIGAA